MRIAAAFVLLASMPAAATSKGLVGTGWLSWSQTYRRLQVSALEGVTTRLILMLVAVAVAAAFIVLVPRGRTIFTGLGRWSMYPYLLHGALAWEFSWTGLARQVTTPWAFVAMLAGAGAIALALASPPIRKLVAPIVNPQATWLLRDARPKS
jgi:fucose 4-O-acetylase-like acetyltransferase